MRAVNYIHSHYIYIAVYCLYTICCIERIPYVGLIQTSNRRYTRSTYEINTARGELHVSKNLQRLIQTSMGLMDTLVWVRAADPVGP